MDNKGSDSLELKELTEKFQNIFGNLKDFKIDSLNNSNCEKFIELVNRDLETDYLQKIWQFYMADREGKKQDFTPKSLGKLVAELTKSTTEEWCYDMCSGSGALTIQKWVTNKNLKFVCEELDTNLIPFLLFNLKIRNIEGYVINGNVFGERKAVYKLTKGNRFSEIELCMFFEYPNFDCGISNPPFNLKGEYEKEVKLKNMNFAFVFKMLERVGENFVFILPAGVLTSKIEKEARKYLTENKKIRAIVSVPEKMFESTGVATTVLYFTKSSEEVTLIYNANSNFEIEKREQKGEAHNRNRTYIKEFNTLSEENIKKILKSIVEQRDEDDFCATKKLKEIKDYNWNPGRYIEIKIEEEVTRSYKDILKDLERILKQKNQNKLIINEVWAKELGFLQIYEDAVEGDKIIEEISNTLNATLNLKIELPKQNFIGLTKSKELKWENKDKEELSSAITIALQTWKTMLHYFNKEENRYLKELSDKLLPDLMSGKLEIKGE